MKYSLFIKKLCILLGCMMLHALCLFSVHAADNELVARSRPMLHTLVEIKAWGSGVEQAIEEAFAEMERVNGLLNNYDEQSEVSAINRHAGGEPVTISPETAEALTLAVKYGDITGGALDITIWPLLRLWGFGKDLVGLEEKEPDQSAIRKAQSLVDYHALKLTEETAADGSVKYLARLGKKGMWIDVGSFSKGYVADKAVAVLRKHHIENALVIAGGTVCGLGCKPDGSLWQIGIQHPRKQGRILAALSLKNCSISTAGDYENFYLKNGKRRSHIIDPRTGRPAPYMESVSVIASDGVTSDLLDTPLFILGPEKGMQVIRGLKGVEALMVSEGGTMVYSEGWPEKNIIY